MTKRATKWANRVFQKVLKDLEKTMDRHQKGKKVDLSRWGTLENLAWIIECMQEFLQE